MELEEPLHCGGSYEKDRFSVCRVDRDFRHPGDPTGVRAGQNAGQGEKLGGCNGGCHCSREKNAQALELQCNEGVSGCKALPGGSYLMVELPKNYGIYDCKNVEMYRGDQAKPDAAEQIGNYCLVEK